MNFQVKRLLIPLALTAVLFVLVAGARAVQDVRKQQNAQQVAQQAIAVTSVMAAQESMPIVATGIGTVTPIYSVLVKTRVDGQLERTAFTEGQNVKAGELLAQIDPRALEAQLDQFEAQKARDEAQLKNAQVDFERYTKLLAQDSIARQQVDTQRATVDQLKATVKLDQAQIDNAKVQVDYTTIRAPITGRTGKRLVDPGNIVHAADTTGLVTINQIDPISVLFTLPEEQFHAVIKGQAASRGQALAVQAYGRTDGTPLGTGKLTLVDNQIDTTTGTIELRAVFPNAADALWPGQYVSVRVVLRKIKDAVTIPDAAVQRGPQGLFVYVVRPDATVAAQPVSLTQSDGGKAIVAQGIAPGERVVVDGQYKLKLGVKVTEANANEGIRNGALSSQRSLQ